MDKVQRPSDSDYSFSIEKMQLSSIWAMFIYHCINGTYYE
jgi:hypothetical protein